MCYDTCTEMAKLHGMANSYYTINRILLLCVGLWPYQTFASRVILITFITVLLISSVVIQFSTLVTIEYEMEVLLHILAYSIPWLVFLVKYNLLCLNIQKMQNLMDRVQCDWNELNNVQEIEIIKKYSALGRFFTIFCTLFLYTSLLFVGLMLISSNFILNEITAVNDSHSLKLPMLVEYFIDQQKYNIPIVVHVFLFALCAINTVLATDTLNMSYTLHSCGLFEIASFRVEQALHKNMIKNMASPGEEKLVTRQMIIDAIKIYRKATEFIALMDSNFKWSYLVILPLGVISLSVNLYRLSHLTLNREYYEMIISIFFVTAYFGYMFCCNYMGQQVIDYSSNTFYRIYNTQWYVAPLETQKLLLFMMQRSIRHCKIVVGGLYTLSLQGFATLVNTSLSYFMMILSVNST